MSAVIGAVGMNNGPDGGDTPPGPRMTKLLRSLTTVSKFTTPRIEGQPSVHKPIRPAHGKCRLTLTINGTSYVVRPITADPSIADQAIRLRKADGTVYHVTRHVYGAECDCPDFTFNRDGYDPDGCKHIKALVASGMIAPNPEPLDDSSADEWSDWTDEDRWSIV